MLLFKFKCKLHCNVHFGVCFNKANLKRGFWMEFSMNWKLRFFHENLWLIGISSLVYRAYKVSSNLERHSKTMCIVFHLMAVNVQNDITHSMHQISSAIRRNNTFHREFNEKLSHCFNSIFSNTIEFNSIGLHSNCVIAFVEKFLHYERAWIYFLFLITPSGNVESTHRIMNFIQFG